MKNLFILLYIFLVALPTYATNWVEVSRGTYIDKDTIKYENFQGEQIATYWSLELNTERIESLLNKKISRIISKDAAYCGSRLSKMMESYAYDEQGHIVRSYTFYDIPNMSSIVPDSTGEVVFNFVCQYGNKNFNQK